jgi:NAD-dependent DNA ligase
MTRPSNNQRESDFPFIGKVAARELALAGYIRLEQLTKVSEKDLLRLHGVGPKALRILTQALAEKGLAFTAGIIWLDSNAVGAYSSKTQITVMIPHQSICNLL